MYAERTPPATPPCETCRVELVDENQEAAKVFMMTRNQVVSVGGQVADISIPAVKIVMDLYQVRNQRECFEKVRGLFLAMMSKMPEAGGDEN